MCIQSALFSGIFVARIPEINKGIPIKLGRKEVGELDFDITETDIPHNIRNMPCTTHSLNPVPFIICGPYNFSSKKGRLSDIAPTILKLLGISRPNDMNGRSLIK